MVFKGLKKVLAKIVLIVVLLLPSGLMAQADSSPLNQATNKPSNSVVFLLDVSSKMWASDKGPALLDQIKQSLRETIPTLAKEVDVRLAVYGRDRYHPCYDMDFLTGFTSKDSASSVVDSLDKIEQKIKYPIELALQPAVFAAEEGHESGRNSVILISGGAEVCGADPCVVAERLARSNPNLRFEVIGYNVPSGGYPQKELQCIAERSGGTYTEVNSKPALDKALEQVTKLAKSAVPKAKPQASYQEVLRDDFDGSALSEKWNILNPNASAYSVADGKLKLDADNQSGESGVAIKNVLQLKTALPQKDWRLSAQVDMQPQTSHEEFSIGVTQEHKHYISASIVPLGFAPTTFSLVISDTNEKNEIHKSTTMYRDVLKGWNGIVGFAKDKMPFVLELIKEGDRYRARAVSVVDKRFVFETEALKVPALQGSPFINLHQRKKSTYHIVKEGEHTGAQVDWVKFESVP